MGQASRRASRLSRTAKRCQKVAGGRSVAETSGKRWQKSSTPAGCQRMRQKRVPEFSRRRQGCVAAVPISAAGFVGSSLAPPIGVRNRFPTDRRSPRCFDLRLPSGNPSGWNGSARPSSASGIFSVLLPPGPALNKCPNSRAPLCGPDRRPACPGSRLCASRGTGPPPGGQARRPSYVGRSRHEPA